MKFVISSTELLSHLQAISRVISNKNTLPILDNLLFQLSDNELKITASDLETTLITTITLENVTDEGSIAIPARILTDTLKEFPDQPLTFDINTDTFGVVITTENGKYNIDSKAIFLVPCKKSFMPTSYYIEGCKKPLEFTNMNRGIPCNALSLLWKYKLYKVLMELEEKNLNFILIVILLASMIMYGVSMYFQYGGAI